MAKYTIGVDFGTLSARALVVDTANGRELACAAMDYPHGVMDRVLCTTGTPLPPSYALQHPADYLTVLSHVIPTALREAGVCAGEIVGIGVDFTSCTLLPVDEHGTPLCLLPAFEREPLSYALLWKHHAAKPYAEHLTEVARARGERFLSHYGGKMDDQWTLPKIAEVMAEAPAVYAAADRFLEGGDFVVQSITGTDVRSYHFAAYKTQYDEQAGYPSAAYLDSAYPAWSETLFPKLRGPLKKQGGVAGYLNADYAAKLGLCAGTPVAVPVPDAHSAAGALGMGEHGDMFAVLGTSGCFMAIGREALAVPGICGSVKDGILPGTCGYESGLCSLGDHFAYAAENLTSPAYVREAAERGIGMLPLLLEKAAQ
ncbi:MAG: ribulokinase, partial [Clostridia bacterium]|nr:ribulokinase [Clostridia bacterium]